MEVIDTRGLRDSKPLIMIKQALKDLSMPEEFLIILDSITSKEDIEIFLKKKKIFFKTIIKGNNYEIIVNKKKGELPVLDSEEKSIICFANNQFGNGNKELGNELIKEFISALKTDKIKISKIIFFNSGVLLLKQNSIFLDEFKNFERAGIKLLVCEKSLKFYNLEDKIDFGIIVNFKQISHFMINAKKVLVV